MQRGERSEMREKVNAYTVEKLLQAMHCLISDAPMTGRLTGAGMYLIRLTEKDFPEDLRADWQRIIHAMTDPPTGSVDPQEGTIEANCKALTVSDQTRLAHAILSLFMACVARDALNDRDE
jgi:hypothetical protein